MAGANRMDFSKARMPLGNVTNILPDTPKTSRFDPQTMKSFMDGLKTNAEIRKDALKARQSSNNNTEDEVRRTSSVTKNNIETTPSGHLNFGIGFGTFVDNNVRDEESDRVEQDETLMMRKNSASINVDILAPSVEKGANEEASNAGDASTTPAGPSRPRTARKVRVVRDDSGNSIKTETAARKAFLNVFRTLKKKLDNLHSKNGQVPDFALIVKNSVQPSNVKNAARSAGKYLTFTKGSLSDRIFSQDGIKFHPDEYFVCKNADTMMEERNLPFQKSMQNSDDVPNNKKKKEIKEATVIDDEEESSESSISDEKSESSQIDEEFDLFNAAKTARKVSWGAPERDSVTSDSSGGARQYGRGAEKAKDKRHAKKKEMKKKHLKAASEKGKDDILDRDGFGPPNRNVKGPGNHSRGGKKASGPSRGKSRRGRR